MNANGEMFERLFGKGRRAEAARKAELRGELAEATVLFAEAGLPAEAARVLVLRGDAEQDPARRLQAYAQAAQLAPGEAVAAVARRKRALLVVALAAEGAVSAAVRQDLLEAGRELEELGDPEGAARAYARAGDTTNEARALAQAGEVDRLEELLTEEQEREREARRRTDAHADIELQVRSGGRREAMLLAEALAKNEKDPRSAAQLLARADALRSRRAAGPVARIALGGAPLALVLGHEIVIGRTDGSLRIASAAVSRRHLSLARKDGSPVVRDLDTRNGTTLRGLALSGAVPVGDGLDLRLGREVPLRLVPSAALEGAIEIELAGERYVAPLGEARLGIGRWRLELASDGWLELSTDDDPPALCCDRATQTQMVPRSTLLVGDAIARARGEEPVLRVGG